ncbi:MAG: hypothetical protein HRT88_18650, partial [Lentisphaeraceae bacterium]|nr:hypothetical protein [Lentisphaeraceae bacterium]
MIITFADTLAISINLTFVNAGPYKITFDGSSLTAKRLFTISGGDVSFKKFTFANGSGDKGGAINSSTSGTVTIEDSTFNNNIVTGRGGAIYASSGYLVVTSSTFDGNNSKSGTYDGGSDIAMIGTLDATIDNVTTNTDGYSIWTDSTSLTLNISNSTFKSTTYAFVDRKGPSSATRTVTNTILVGGVTKAGSTIFTNSWSTTDLNANGKDTSANNVQSSEAKLKLRDLADNGGDVQTMALGFGSTAINAATGTDKDARGFDVSGVKDIGAFEYIAGTLPVIESGSIVSPFTISSTDQKVFTNDFSITDPDIVENDITIITVSTADYGTGDIFVATPSANIDVNTSNNGTIILTAKAGMTPTYAEFEAVLKTITYSNSNGNGDRTFTASIDITDAVTNFDQLKQAITDASTGDTIKFSSNSDLIITFTETLAIDKNLTFVNNGPYKITFDGSNSKQLFNISGGDVSFKQFTFANGAGDNGGAIYSDTTGTVTIEDSTFNNNIVTNKGGAIFAKQGYLVVKNSTFDGNNSLFDGYTGGSDFALIGGLTKATIDNVTTNGTGNSFWNDGNDVNYEITNSTFKSTNRVFWDKKNHINGTKTVTNTILVGDVTNAGKTIFTNSLSTTTNLDANGKDTSANNIQSTEVLLKLGTLADNGGKVQTMALGVGSSAIDKGTGNGADARGTTPSGTKDIGAYEFIHIAPTVALNTTALEFTEGGTAVNILAGIALTDDDAITSVTVTVSGVEAADVLAIPVDALFDITNVTLDGTTTITIAAKNSATTTYAQYVTALESITFINASEALITGSRTISVVANDAASNSTPATTTLVVTGENDAPTGMVTIEGDATQGQTLSADTASIADVDGLGTFSYQWTASGSSVVIG